MLNTENSDYSISFLYLGSQWNLDVQTFFLLKDWKKYPFYKFFPDTENKLGILNTFSTKHILPNNSFGVAHSVFTPIGPLAQFFEFFKFFEFSCKSLLTNSHKILVGNLLEQVIWWKTITSLASYLYYIFMKQILFIYYFLLHFGTNSTITWILLSGGEF